MIDSVTQRLQDANEALQRGDFALAESTSRDTLRDSPDHPDALLHLGLALQFLGRYGEAETQFARLAQLQPDEPAHWINLGTARRCDGRADEALGAYLRAAQLGESSADFFFNIGLAHVERRDFEAARAVFAKALVKAPRDAEIRVACARACYESLLSEEATRQLEGWRDFEGANATTLADVAFLQMNLGQAAEAEQALNLALAEPECPPSAALTIVKLLERTNRLDAAQNLFEQVSADPRSATEKRDLRLAETQLAQRRNDHERASVLFRQALTDPAPFDARHYQLFPLAKSLDALGQYDDAFDVLREAHRSQVAWIEKTSPAVALRGAPTMEITRHGCSEQDVAAWTDPDPPALADCPIFIVAFPRSGTTLLELTLDAHPDLVSMDEQPFLQNVLDDILALPQARYPDGLANLDGRQLQYLRSRYWERTLSRVRLAPGQRLVDKNPLNLLRLPAIRRVFPRSPIVCVVRHPYDVLLSCYMQHFRAPDFAMMCRDLPTLALGYRRAFEFWYEQSRLLQPNSLELRYESFVGEFETQTRELARFLDLPWHDALLDTASHARSKGFISTPSYAQVVQPINRRSVDRWRHYSRHFAAIAPMIEPLAQRWGYDCGGLNSR